LIRPSASSSPVVEDKTCRTSYGVVISIHTIKELVTDFDIFVSKVSVLSWAILSRLGRFWELGKSYDYIKQFILFLALEFC